MEELREKLINAILGEIWDFTDVVLEADEAKNLADLKYGFGRLSGLRTAYEILFIPKSESKDEGLVRS